MNEWFSVKDRETYRFYMLVHDAKCNSSGLRVNSDPFRIKKNPEIVLLFHQVVGLAKLDERYMLKVHIFPVMQNYISS